MVFCLSPRKRDVMKVMRLFKKKEFVLRSYILPPQSRLLQQFRFDNINSLCLNVARIKRILNTCPVEIELCGAHAVCVYFAIKRSLTRSRHRPWFLIIELHCAFGPHKKGNSPVPPPEVWS